jgi:uncharacterized protein
MPRPVFSPTIAGQRARLLLDAVEKWAGDRPDILAVALIGSWARGVARPDSDIDLLVIAQDTAGYFAWQDWLSDFGKPTDRARESVAGLSALRAWYADGPEVEFILVTPAQLEDASVLLDAGSMAIHDPNDLLARRASGHQ